MKLHVKQLPCPEPEFLQALADYRAARDAHKLTVGVPAPFPPFEIMRVIVDRGEELTIEPEPEAPEVEAGKAAGRDVLAELDEIKSKLAALEGATVLK